MSVIAAAINSEKMIREGQPARTAAHALDVAVEALLSIQNDDGHWRGELEGDSITNSEYILMKWILFQEDDVRLPKILNYLRRLQRADGAWGQYPGSPVDVSATVKAYVCLLLAGDSPNAAHMKRAREAVRSNGGAEACNSFTNFYFACLGLIDWDACPAIPAEIVFIPRGLDFNMDHLSAWSRTMILPLAICSALRPVRRLHKEISIDDLFLDRRYRNTLSARFERNPVSWKNFFLLADRAMKVVQSAGVNPVRERAIEAAERWLLERADGAHTAGLGAIFPPMVYLQVALQALGYARSHPTRLQAERDLDALMIEEEIDGEATIRIQPCFSPVWDTGIALYALTDCGFGVHRECGERSVARACAWLRSKENRLAGDWSRTVSAEAGGWYFEYLNEWYPDVDDTAMVAMALKRAGGRANAEAAQRGVRWILAMQNEDGGWAAFDKTRDRPMLEQVPFADHNAIQDPSCADITGRVLECLAWNGFDTSHEAVRQGIAFLKRTQETEGCWIGRWGVNYIYGTWQAVGGLARLGVDMEEKWIQRAGRWLKSVQKADGSFGETANSYLDPTLKGRGPSTASQTAWGAMAMMAIYGRDDEDAEQAIRWLCETQITNEMDEAGRTRRDPIGSWEETAFTGTGFPKVYYLRYHLYRLYFPLMALARYVVG